MATFVYNDISDCVIDEFRFTDETSQRDCDEYFSEMVSNVINISQLKSYISTSEENYDVLLNEEQYEVLNSGAFPLIIYGCAGSGKTVLSTHLIYGFIKSGYGRLLYNTLGGDAYDCPCLIWKSNNEQRR